MHFQLYFLYKRIYSLKFKFNNLLDTTSWFRILSSKPNGRSGRCHCLTVVLKHCVHRFSTTVRPNKVRKQRNELLLLVRLYLPKHEAERSSVSCPATKDAVWLELQSSSLAPSWHATYWQSVSCTMTGLYITLRYDHLYTVWLPNCDGLIALLRYTADDHLAVSRQTDDKKQEDRFYVQNVCRRHWELLYKGCRSLFNVCLCYCWKTEKLINVDLGSM
jgi:hypothetical protein